MMPLWTELNTIARALGLGPPAGQTRLSGVGGPVSTAVAFSGRPRVSNHFARLAE